jgi:SAM-dependent methyltransferase
LELLKSEKMMKTSKTDKNNVFRQENAKKYHLTTLAITHHDSFQRKVAQVVLAEVVEPARRMKKEANLCELGVGTGVSLSFLLQETSNLQGVNRLYAVDISPAMIEEAKKEIDQSKVDYINEDAVDFLPNIRRLDGIYSVYTIHNLIQEKQKRIFEMIFDSLKKEGCFIYGDLLAYSDSKDQRKAFDWLISRFENTLPSPQREQWIRHIHEDQENYFTLEKVVSFLESIGFKVQVLFREKLEAILLAKKDRILS